VIPDDVDEVGIQVRSTHADMRVQQAEGHAAKLDIVKDIPEQVELDEVAENILFDLRRRGFVESHFDL
jgi:hypothetical protein